MTIFATKPSGAVKVLPMTDNKFGFINAFGNPSVSPSPLPMPTIPRASQQQAPSSSHAAIPSPAPTPVPTPVPAPVPVPIPEPAPATKGGGGDAAMKVDSEHYIVYGIAAIVGGTAGYFVSKKYMKNIYGGIILGAGIGSGSAYLYYNGKSMVAKVKGGGEKPQVTSDKSNASGSVDTDKCKKECLRKYKPMADYWKAQYYKTPFTNPLVPLARPKITLSQLNNALAAIGKAYDCCMTKCSNPLDKCDEGGKSGRSSCKCGTFRCLCGSGDKTGTII